MNRPLVSYGLFVQDEDGSIKPCAPVTQYQLEKTVQDTQVPGPFKLSEPMVTGASTDSGTSTQPSIFESTNLSESTPKMPNDQANIADVEMKDSDLNNH